MRETVWINIPLKFKGLLDTWREYYAYDTEDSELGRLVSYRIDTNRSEYANLISFLEKNDIYYYIFRRWYRFTKKEKDESEILLFWTDDDAKDSYTSKPKEYICNKCGKKVPLVERGRLYVDLKKINKYDIMSTYNGDEETIVSEKVKQLFIEENISGVEFKPLYQINTENKIIAGFYHLILKGGIGEVVEPSIIEKKNLCPQCGLYDEYICKTTLNFKRNTWEGLDICYTKDWFSAPPKFKRLVVSNKLYKVLMDNKIRNVYFQPAYFID